MRTSIRMSMMSIRMSVKTGSPSKGEPVFTLILMLIMLILMLVLIPIPLETHLAFPEDEGRRRLRLKRRHRRASGRDVDGEGILAEHQRAAARRQRGPKGRRRIVHPIEAIPAA